MKLLRGKFLVAVSISSMVVASAFAYHALVLAGLRREDEQRLRALWSVVMLYRQDQQGNWPATLESLDQQMVGRLIYFPRVRDDQTEPRRDRYIYVNWGGLSNEGEIQAKFPLIYDRRFNQQGAVAVIMVDGSLRWDVGGLWLKAFAREHRWAKLAMPDDTSGGGKI